MGFFTGVWIFWKMGFRVANNEILEIAKIGKIKKKQLLIATKNVIMKFILSKCEEVQMEVERKSQLQSYSDGETINYYILRMRSKGCNGYL